MITALKKTYEVAKLQHVEDWNKREAEFKQRSADLQVAHEKQCEVEQKELAGLRASIAKAKKMAVDVEKESEARILASKEKAEREEALAKGTLDGLAVLEREAKARIDTLNESFRDLLKQHGLGSFASQSN